MKTTVGDWLVSTPTTSTRACFSCCNASSTSTPPSSSSACVPRPPTWTVACEWVFWFNVALRPQRRVGLLGTGREWKGDERVKGSTAETARKRPERPWTAARTMEVLRQCPLAIGQRLVHCPVAVSTTVLGSHKDNVCCTAAEEQPEVKEVQLSQPSSTSLLMISSGLRVQLYLPALDLT